MQMSTTVTLPFVAILAVTAASYAQEDVTEPWPATPSSSIRTLETHHGKTVQVFKNEWGYDVQDTGDARLILAPRNLVEAPGPGQPPADYFRQQGFVFIDRQTGDSLRKLEPCRYEISYTLSSGERDQRIHTFGCLTDPASTVSVKPLDSGAFRYSYSFFNSSNASQRIRMIRLGIPERGIIRDKSEAAGWYAGRTHLTAEQMNVSEFTDLSSTPPTVSWSPHAVAGGDLSIPPGGEVSDLSFTSSYLPSVAEVSFFGVAAESLQPEQPLREEFPHYLNAAYAVEKSLFDHVRRVTIGPQIAPPGDDPRARRAVLSRLLEDVAKAVEGGLVPDKRRSEVQRLLEEAGTAVVLGDSGTLEEIQEKFSSDNSLDEGYRQSLSVVISVLGKD